MRKSGYQGMIFTTLSICLNTLLSSTPINTIPFLPKPIEHLEKIDKGCGNDVWLIHTTTNRYILRAPKTLLEPALFLNIITACQKTAEWKLSPKLIYYELENQRILLEYIDAAAWPSYEENPQPYHATMKALSRFHTCLKPQKIAPTEKNNFPFSLIFKEAESLQTNPSLPEHFSIALKILRSIEAQFTPYLKKWITVCHGDFHTGNVLLQENTEGLIPWIIDLDSLDIGHPFFDVAKFTIALTPKQRTHLFCEYLGKDTPSWEEQMQWEWIDLSLLLLISTIRFKLAYEANQNAEALLSKSQMHAVLNSKEPYPSFLSIPFKDTTIQDRQLGALYALKEFLEKAEKQTKLNY